MRDKNKAPSPASEIRGQEATEMHADEARDYFEKRLAVIAAGRLRVDDIGRRVVLTHEGGTVEGYLESIQAGWKRHRGKDETLGASVTLKVALSGELGNDEAGRAGARALLDQWNSPAEVTLRGLPEDYSLQIDRREGAR